MDGARCEVCEGHYTQRLARIESHGLGSQRYGWNVLRAPWVVLRMVFWLALAMPALLLTVMLALTRIVDDINVVGAVGHKLLAAERDLGPARIAFERKKFLAERPGKVAELPMAGKVRRDA